MTPPTIHVLRASPCQNAASANICRSHTRKWLPASPPSSGGGFLKTWMLAQIIAAASVLALVGVLRRPWHRTRPEPAATLS